MDRAVFFILGLDARHLLLLPCFYASVLPVPSGFSVARPAILVTGWLARHVHGAFMSWQLSLG